MLRDGSSRSRGQRRGQSQGAGRERQGRTTSPSRMSIKTPSSSARTASSVCENSKRCCTSISSGYHGENSSSDGEPSSQPPALQIGIARPGSGFLSLPSVDSELAAMSHRSTIAPLGRVDPPQVPPTSHSTRLARHRRDFFDKARRLVGCVRVCRRSRGTLRVVLISVCTTHVCAGLHKKPHLEAKLCVADSNLVSPRSPWDSTNRAALVAS